MQASKKFISVFVISLFFALTSFSQNAEVKDTTQTKLISVAREIMQAAKTCALITLDDEGNTRVRTMDPFLPEENFTVWLGTNSNSRKVKQIKKHPGVTLYYLDSDASGYVVIEGTAELIDNKEAKKKWWKKEWEAFYPNKADTYLLIKITPQWMEVSSTPRGILSDPLTWQPQKVVFN